MITTIDNNQRVFLIHRDGFFTRDYFCNIHDIPTILKAELEPHDSFTISEYWNKKLKKVSKKRMNEMFEANQVKCKL